MGPIFPGGRLDDDDRRRVIDHVDTVLRDPSLDGGDATAVSPAVVVNAKRLIEVFPPLAMLPEVVATEHGELRFDWVASATCTLTLTVGEDPRLGVSALFDDTLVSGNESWDGTLPLLVSYCFERLRRSEAEASAGPGGPGRGMSERRLRNRVFKAIEGAKEAWQDLASISRRSALPEELVLRVLYGDSSDVISERRASGKVVFSTRRHFLDKASAAQKLLGAFRNRLR